MPKELCRLTKPMVAMVAACGIAALLGLQSPPVAAAEPTPGITENEIVLGTSTALSGSNAATGTIGKAQKAYYDFVNAEHGGVKMGDGKTRKIKFVMYDDALEPARALQNARRLVEQDKVFAIVGSTGTSACLAARDYLNQRKVPQAFLSTGAPMWGSDVAKYPWTFGIWPAYNTEAAIYARYIKEQVPNAKIALMGDDSGGPLFTNAFVEAAKKEGLNIVIKEAYSNSDPTIDAKIDRLAASGADVFVDATTTKFTIQGLKRMAAIKWQPVHIIWGVSNSIGAVLKVAGEEASKGVLSGQWYKDASSSAYANDPGVKQFSEKVVQYGSGIDPHDSNAEMGWIAAEAVVKTLEQMKSPTREAFMEAARNMKDQSVSLLLDGVKMTMGANDGYLIESLQVARFDGQNYVPVGGLVSYEGKTPVSH